MCLDLGTRWRGCCTPGLRICHMISRQTVSPSSPHEIDGFCRLPTTGFKIGQKNHKSNVTQTKQSSELRISQDIWLVVSNMIFIFHNFDGIIPTPLTNSSFSRWLLHQQAAQDILGASLSLDISGGSMQVYCRWAFPTAPRLMNRRCCRFFEDFLAEKENIVQNGMEQWNIYIYI